MGETDDAALRIAPLLAPGERLLWSDRPSPGGLFFANLGRVLVDLIWSAAAIAGFVTAIHTRSETGFAACGIFLFIFASSLWRNLRTAFGARHIVYAITDRRIIRQDDRDAKPFVVYRGRPEDPMAAWLDGQAKSGWSRGGRATVKIPYRAFMAGTMRSNDGEKRAWLRLPGTALTEEAVAILNHGRRR